MSTFCIVVPAYRASAWIGRCVQSIRQQRHDDFRCVVIDDASDDGTFETAVAAADGDPRIEVVRADERRRALGNVVWGIDHLAACGDEVIVIVDGDDWLAHDGVLARLEEEYVDPEVWLTYGSYRRWKDSWRERRGWKVRKGVVVAYPASIAAKNWYRYFPFVASHLRTFRAFLWRSIRDEDLRDEQGSYLPATGDMASMMPMMEMAGVGRTRLIKDILYVYNCTNPLSVHRIARETQSYILCAIRAKAPYARLEQAPEPG